MSTNRKELLDEFMEQFSNFSNAEILEGVGAEVDGYTVYTDGFREWLEERKASGEERGNFDAELYDFIDEELGV